MAEKIAKKQTFKLRNTSVISRTFIYDNESYTVHPNMEIEVPFERIPDGCERVTAENTVVAEQKAKATAAEEAKKAKASGIATSQSVGLNQVKESKLGEL